jgi:hypothetical protein
LVGLFISPLIDEPMFNKGFRQDGETLLEAYAMPRDITIDLIIFDADIDQAVRDFKRIFNPKLGLGVLRFTNDHMDCAIDVKIDAEPQTPYEDKKYMRGFAHATISMTAPLPFWRDLEYTQKDIAGLSGGFYWDDPTYFDGPFYMGELLGSSAVLTNEGDVPAPLYIIWTGAAENPRLTLEDTGEFLLLNKVLTSDQRLIITTGYGDKNVFVETISTGEIVKDNSFLDKSSEYFQLPIGNSTMSFSADSGTGLLSVKYKQLYIGV